MSTTTLPDDLTDRQRSVLQLIGEGKTPTEIGAELGISSQGVHGHLQRLRKRGLVPDEPAATQHKREGARQRERRTIVRVATPADAFAAVRASIVDQRQGLTLRGEQLDREVDELKAAIEDRRKEKRTIDKALADLDKFEQTIPA